MYDHREIGPDRCVDHVNQRQIQMSKAADSVVASPPLFVFEANLVHVSLSDSRQRAKNAL